MRAEELAAVRSPVALLGEGEDARIDALQRPLPRLPESQRVAPAFVEHDVIEIDWDDVTEAVPALVTALAMPFTFSIAAGIGLGFISYVTIKLVSGRAKDVNAAVAIIAAAFVAKIIFA